MDALAPAPETAPPPAPARADASPDRSGWAQLREHNGRGWKVLAAMAGFAAVLGAAMGAGVHRSPLVPTVAMAVMTVCLARGAWGWMRGRSRRARIREGLLTHVEQYGGGIYGTGAAMTLLVLSASSFREEWAQSAGMMDFLRGLTLEWWIGFSGESILNAVQAGLWPFHWYTYHGLTAALAVGAAAWAGDALADAWRRREPLAAADAEAPSGEISTPLAG